MMLIIDTKTGKPVPFLEFLEEMKKKLSETKAKNISEPETDLFAKKESENVENKITLHPLPQFMIDLLEKEQKSQVVKEKEGKVVEMKPVSEECTGNPDDCPVCGEEIELIDFSSALHGLKIGYAITRKSWIGNVSGHLVYVPGATFGGMKAEEFIAFFDTDDNSIAPYSFNSYDLLAEDWILIKE